MNEPNAPIASRLALRFRSGRRVPLGGVGTALVVGRGPRSDVLVDDPEVSGRHLKVVVEASGIRVVDLGSLNGTFLGGERIAEGRARPGDVIAFGATLAMLEPEAAQPHPVEAAAAPVRGANPLRKITWALGVTVLCLAAVAAVQSGTGASPETAGSPVVPPSRTGQAATEAPAVPTVEGIIAEITIEEPPEMAKEAPTTRARPRAPSSRVRRHLPAPPPASSPLRSPVARPDPSSTELDPRSEPAAPVAREEPRSGVREGGEDAAADRIDGYLEQARRSRLAGEPSAALQDGLAALKLAMSAGLDGDDDLQRRIESEMIRCYGALGAAALADEEYREAREHYTDGYSLDPSDEEIRGGLSRLEVACQQAAEMGKALYEQHGRVDQARRYYRAAEAACPEIAGFGLAHRSEARAWLDRHGKDGR